MRRMLLPLVLLAALSIGAYWYSLEKETSPVTSEKKVETSAITIIARDLEIPWDIAFLPEGGILVTERTGHLIEIRKDGTKHEIAVEGVKRGGESGLLGITLHPDFSRNRLLYLYMSTLVSGGETQNRVERYRYTDGVLVHDMSIITGIPGAIYHDGGRMEFGPDGLLYITTGDATRSHIAQDKNSLGGKILRLKDDGSIPGNNPFGTAIYSYGHRNPQGLVWDGAGNLWETEHGRSGVTSGMDEINVIRMGANYGWPTIEGDETAPGMVSPALQSGASDTWAPASAAYLKGSLFFGGLRGEALYEAVLRGGNSVSELKTHLKGVYGRIRTVRVGPDGMLYLTTSNRDGRGNPASDDDILIRVDPKSL